MLNLFEEARIEFETGWEVGHLYPCLYFLDKIFINVNLKSPLDILLIHKHVCVMVILDFYGRVIAIEVEPRSSEAV